MFTLIVYLVFDSVLSSSILPVFDSMKTEYRNLLYFRCKFNLIKQVLGNEKSCGKVEQFEFIPTNEVFMSLFQHDDVFSEVMNSLLQCNSGVLGSFCDGSYFQANSLFSSDWA